MTLGNAVRRISFALAMAAGIAATALSPRAAMAYAEDENSGCTLRCETCTINHTTGIATCSNCTVTGCTVRPN